MMLHNIPAAARFLVLLDELERFQLPPRVRINPGEAIGGKVRATVTINGQADAAVGPAPSSGRIAAIVAVGMSARAEQLRLREAVKPIVIKSSRKKPATLKPSSNLPKPSRAPRSAEAIASASAANRAYREARIEALLPLVDEARREGCVTLADICQFLDSIGHKPAQGEKWSKQMLQKMLPRMTDEERQLLECARKIQSDRFAGMVSEARNAGAVTNDQIADWLNARGHRTATGLAWTTANIARFRRETEEGREAQVIRLAKLFTEAVAAGATSDSQIAKWLNARSIKTVGGNSWETANVNYFRRHRM